MAVALCALLGGCRAEFSVDAGTFAPSVGEVRTLLDQDRVRQALVRAEALNARYSGAEAAIVYGWAAWRNGDMRVAETQFRRAVDAGAASANVGLAALRASTADWSAAVEFANAAMAGDDLGPAHALLASAAWVRGDAQTASRELRAWSIAEPGTARGRAAESMAAASARLRGAAREWVGEPSAVPLVVLEGGGYGVRVEVDGQPALLKLDLTFRQSAISPSLASAAGLVVDGSGGANTRSATSRWPALLSPQQAAVEVVNVGGMQLRNIVVGVADVPIGVDGVLAADALSAVRWSLMFDDEQLVVAPASTGTDRLEGVEVGEAIAWMQGRVTFEGLGVQVFLFPRVSSRVVAAGLDIGASSRLDADDVPVSPGANTTTAELMLGGWKGDVNWRPSSLAGWALDGGVAPTAVVGNNVLDAWALHWYPQSRQIRVDSSPVSSRRP